MKSLGKNVSDLGMKKQTSEHKKWWEKSQIKKNYLIILWNVCMSKKIVKACNKTRCMSEISQDKMLMF